jgi:hypothetical protein
VRLVAFAVASAAITATAAATAAAAAAAAAVFQDEVVAEGIGRERTRVQLGIERRLPKGVNRGKVEVIWMGHVDNLDARDHTRHGRTLQCLGRGARPIIGGTVPTFRNFDLRCGVQCLVPSLIWGLQAVQGLRVVPVFMYRYSIKTSLKKARGADQTRY